MIDIVTANDLAKAMRVNVESLIWLAKHASEKYTELQTPKKKGGTRVVYDPQPVLRQAQAWLLSNVLERIDPSEWAKAYGKGSSTVNAVSPHAGNLTVIRIDFTDFFGHISAWRVGTQYDNCGLGADAANMARDLSCRYGYLPQGGITSPSLSNLAMKAFDYECAAMLRSWGAIFTRYGDDMIISLPSTIGKDAANRLVNLVGTIAERHGQAINPEKTNIMTGSDRKSALGLVFTDEVTLYRKARRTFRAMCHNLESAMLDPDCEYSETDIARVTAEIRGMFAYMKMVDPKHAGMFLAQYRWLENA